MKIKGDQLMAQRGRPRKNPEKLVRPPKKGNTKEYIKADRAGKTCQEPPIIVSFWKRHKVSDMMQIDPKDLDPIIDQFYEDNERRQKQNNPFWELPPIRKLHPSLQVKR